MTSIPSIPQAPGTAEGTPSHRARARLLSSLSFLAGCNATPWPPPPHNLRPDIIRAAANQRLLFLGDAKATEDPNDRAALGRFYKYFQWLAHWLSPGPRLALCMLCAATRSDAHRWLAALTPIAADAGLKVASSGTTTFDAGFATAWITIETPAPEPDSTCTLAQ